MKTIEQINEWYEENIGEFDQEQLEFITHLVENYKTNYIGPEVDARLNYVNGFFEADKEALQHKVHVDKFITKGDIKTSSVGFENFCPIMTIHNDYAMKENSFFEFGLTNGIHVTPIGRVYQDGYMEFTQQKIEPGKVFPIVVNKNGTICIKENSHVYGKVSIKKQLRQQINK